MTYEIHSLRSGFRQRAPASLTPAKRLTLGCQRSLKMALGQPRGPSWETGTLLAVSIKFLIIAHGGLDCL
jgi:hypothetical protein